MTCKECQDQLILAETENEISEAARQHVAACPTCQENLREDEQLRAQIRRLALSEQAPKALRDAVEKAASVGRTARERPWLRWGKVAAVVLLAGLGGYALKWYTSERAPSPERLAQLFVSDHLHYLPGREQLISNSAQDVERWFQGRVDFPVRVPRLPVAALEDARVCTVVGRKAALVHYRRKPDDTLISLFVVEAPQSLRAPRYSQPLAISYQGCNALMWCRRGLVYSLVAPLDDSSLQQIAQSVRQQEP